MWPPLNKLSRMLPSTRLFLDPNVVYDDRRARQRAKWLFDDVSADIKLASELDNFWPADAADDPAEGAAGDDVGVTVPAAPLSRSGWWNRLARRAKRRGPKSHPFPPLWRREREVADECAALEHAWTVVASVAEDHPRLLAWLAEGRISWYWNLFGTWVAFARLIPGVRRIIWHLLFKPVARRAPWRVELHEAILQNKRYAFNRQDTDAKLVTSLAMRKAPGRRDTPGLSAVTEIANFTRTKSREEVRRKVEKMSSGCIGLSGPRGSGKSALIQDFCGHRYGTAKWSRNDEIMLPGLRLSVRAPLRYDAREFLIYQYTCLCQAVLADVRLNPASFVHHVVIPLLLPKGVRPGTLLRAASGAVLLALSGALAYRAATGAWPVPVWSHPQWDIVGAAAAALAAVIAFGWRTRQALIEVRQIITLAIDAKSRLERLHYQRTDSRSQGGTLRGPMGTAVNFTSTRAFVEQVMTLPELIDDYRELRPTRGRRTSTFARRRPARKVTHREPPWVQPAACHRDR